MTGLADFGHDTMTVDGVEAKGYRPLLVVLVSFDLPSIGGSTTAEPGPLAHDAGYYHQLIFNPFPDASVGTMGRSVNGYYMDVSCGRFQWSRAGDVIGPLHVSIDLAAMHTGERLQTLIPMIAGAGYSFSRVDANADGSVAPSELSVLIIDNGSTSSGQTTSAVRCSVATQSVGDVTVHGSFVGSRPSLTLIAHELSHQLGTADLYGHDGNRNSWVTLTGPEAGDDNMASVHLDPWHKMRLGWAEPTMWALDTFGTVTLPVANSVNPGAAMILHDDSRGPQEFFIVEYRSRDAEAFYLRSSSPGSGLISPNYDSDVAGNGVAIWHVYLVNGEPVELEVFAPGPFPQPPIGTDKSVFVDGAPDFEHGGTQLWEAGQTTPLLRWLDGTETKTRLRIGQFDPLSREVVVEVLAPMIETPVPKSPDRPTHGDVLDGPIRTTRSGSGGDPRMGGITQDRSG
jgi:M6 family metalloprotease-like protein